MIVCHPKSVSTEKQELVELFFKNGTPGSFKKTGKKFPKNLGGSVPNLSHVQAGLNNLRSEYFIFNKINKKIVCNNLQAMQRQHFKTLVPLDNLEQILTTTLLVLLPHHFHHQIEHIILPQA